MNLMKSIRKDQLTLSNVFYFIQGYIRYYIYYSKHFKWLMRKHVKEQIDFRIKMMARSCYNNGSCDLCGCHTTALQMANKSCDKPCYPPMMNRKQWYNFKLTHKVNLKGDIYKMVVKIINSKNTNNPSIRHTLYVNGVRKHIRNLHERLI